MATKTDATTNADEDELKAVKTVTVKNIAKGPRGLHAKNGHVLLESGQSIGNLEVAEGEIRSAESTGHFVISRDNKPIDADDKKADDEKAAS